MEVLTYTSLLADVRRYIERGAAADVSVYTQLPRLISQAERAIATALKVQGFINVVTSFLEVGQSVYDKPDRWRSTISMSFGTGVGNETRRPLYTRAYEYCRAYWPDATQQSVPKFYADYDYSHWLIVPTPVSRLPWEVVYYEMPALLGADNETNWLTDFAPNLLLYRSLLECAPFLGSDDRIATWQGFYNEQLSSISEQDVRRIVDRNSVRRGA